MQIRSNANVKVQNIIFWLGSDKKTPVVLTVDMQETVKTIDRKQSNVITELSLISIGAGNGTSASGNNGQLERGLFYLVVKVNDNIIHFKSNSAKPNEI